MEPTPEACEFNQVSEEYSANNMDSDCEEEVLVEIKIDLLDDDQDAYDEDPLDLKSVPGQNVIQPDIEHADLDPYFIFENEASSFDDEDSRSFMVGRLKLQENEEEATEASRGFQCTACSKVFITEEQVEAHFRYRHQIIKCPECGTLYSGSSSLLNHLNRRHPERKSRFPCSTCGDAFSTAFLLSKHKNNYHGNNEFKCSHCPASFKTKRSLDDHVALTHNSHSSFPCRHCGKMFKLKTYLLAHIRRTHKDEFVETLGKRHLESGERKHPCPKCDASFKDKKTLDGHLKDVHSPKKLPCPHCKMMFNRKFNLKVHIPPHTLPNIMKQIRWRWSKILEKGI